jgi:hypothetical protein
MVFLQSANILIGRGGIVKIADFGISANMDKTRNVISPSLSLSLDDSLLIPFDPGKDGDRNPSLYASRGGGG